MVTKYLKIDDKNRDLVLEEAASLLKMGEVVAFPTETVYGLGGNALDKNAVSKIFEAKKRPSWDPLIVHVCSLEMLNSVISEKPKILEKIVKSFMPGALTVILPKSEIIPENVTASKNTIAVRWPSHPVALELIEKAGVPIAAPSANLFNHPSPTTAQHVLDDLSGRIEMIIDGGEVSIGVESTVLDLTADKPTILRPGGVTKEDLESVIGIVRVKTNIEGEGFKSPGMSLKHYSPKSKLVLVLSEKELKEKIVKNLNKKIGVMLPTDWERIEGIEIFEWGKWGDWEGLAKKMFRGIRDLDKKELDIIICPLPLGEDLGSAIRDRLLRAAA